jgi:hypothetical protein
MEVSDTLKITLKLCGQNFSIDAKRDEEIYYRDAEKLINKQFSYYANSYTGQNHAVYLLMTLIDIAVRYEKCRASGNLEPIMGQLNNLISEVNEALH